VKCYIDNSVRLRSCKRNVNKHFWCRCRGGSLYLLFVYRLHRIIIVSIISLANLSGSLCLCLVFVGRCMTGFDLPANLLSDPESLIRKSRSRFSSLGCSGSRVRDIVDKFQGSPPPQEPHKWLARSALMTFRLHPAVMSELDRRRTSEMVVLNSNQLSSIWCSKACSTARPQRMPMLISNISWRFVARSPSEEYLNMRYAFASFHFHY
jgi:hypothetical protein